ncbi:hypothetical protein EV715DRAFT_171202, partial [Schizophyllum commune]
LPCTGLSGEALEDYFSRPIAGGGGAHSVNYYALDLFQKPYKRLSRNKQAAIRRVKKLAWLWNADTNRKVVYHHDCTNKAVSPATPAPDSKYWPSGAKRNGACDVCCSLWDEPRFRQVVRKPVPDDRNIKYSNKEYVEGHLVRMYSLAKGLKAIVEGKV